MAKFRYVQWLWDWLSALDFFAFDWDAGNTAKSFQKHGITCEEAEEVFTGGRYIPLGEQYQPACGEKRLGILGETTQGKLLFIAFTLRRERIRVISVRPMNDRERKFYASLRQE